MARARSGRPVLPPGDGRTGGSSRARPATGCGCSRRRRITAPGGGSPAIRWCWPTYSTPARSTFRRRPIATGTSMSWWTAIWSPTCRPWRPVRTGRHRSAGRCHPRRHPQSAGGSAPARARPGDTGHARQAPHADRAVGVGLLGRGAGRGRSASSTGSATRSSSARPPAGGRTPFRSAWTPTSSIRRCSVR